MPNKVQNIHLHLTDEPRGDHLTNRCLTVDVRDKGFFMKGWRDESSLDVEYLGSENVEMFSSDDGFEIDIILSSNSGTNVFSYTLQSEGLVFHYQPKELTPDMVLMGSFFREERAKGSYAVYHATKRNNYKLADGSEKNYKCGKFCHIYRPEAIDAEGKRTWCDLLIKDGQMTVTVPQTFLDTATYPVRVDPDFGYTNIGMIADLNSFSRAERGIIGVETGQKLLSLSCYVDQVTSAPQTLKLGLYDDGGTPGTSTSKPLNRLETMSKSISTEDVWHTIDATGDTDVSASTAYWVTGVNNSNILGAYDAPGGNYEHAYGSSANLDDPYTYTATIETALVSMYGTYGSPGAEETSTFLSNSHIWDIETETFNSDSNAYDKETGTSNSDSHIWDIETGTFNSDSDTYAEETSTFTSNATLSSAEETATFNSNSNIYDEETATFNSNSNIYAEGTFNSNSHTWDEAIVIRMPLKIQSTTRNTDTTPQTGGQDDGGFRIL